MLCLRLAVALGGLTLLAGCGQATLDSKAVRTQAETIGSLATEGHLLTDAADQGRISESFLQVQAADLAERRPSWRR
jgi:hypothetical protein